MKIKPISNHTIQPIDSKEPSSVKNDPKKGKIQAIAKIAFQSLSKVGKATISKVKQIKNSVCLKLMNSIAVRAGITNSLFIGSTRKISKEGLSTLNELNPEKIQFKSGNNQLEGMFFQPKEPHQHQKTILIFSGSGNSHEHYTDKMVAPLLEQGHNVMVFNYSGFGRSEGNPSEPQIISDAEAAFEYLNTGRKVNPEEIVLWGYSMGSGAATAVASKHQEASLVLDRPVASYYDEVCNQTHDLPKPIRKVFQSIAKRLDYFNNTEKVASLDNPIILFQETGNLNAYLKLYESNPKIQCHVMDMPHIAVDGSWFDPEMMEGAETADGKLVYQNMENEQQALKEFLSQPIQPHQEKALRNE